MNNLVVSGKRKSSVAKATIVEGEGLVLFNKRPISLLSKFHQLEITEPLIIAKEVLGNLNFNISINARGGGVNSQIEAGRLAIARAIVKFSKNEKVKMAFLAYDRNLLIADRKSVV